MSDAEKKILKIYDGSLPKEEDLFETSHVNQVAWTLAVLMMGLALWLGIALVNAENQRYALVMNKCPDPVFQGQVDLTCLQTVRSRENWWEHLWYGMTHTRPEGPPKK